MRANFLPCTKEPMDLQTFRNVKAELIRAGITQREIAKQLRVSPSTVHKVLRGQCVSARVRKLIGKKLGFDPWQADARPTQQ